MPGASPERAPVGWGRCRPQCMVRRIAAAWLAEALVAEALLAEALLAEALLAEVGSDPVL